MGYIKKNDVIKSIKCRTVNHGDGSYSVYEAYLGTDPYSRLPVRKASISIEKLRKKIDDFYKQLSYGGDAAVLLTAYESTDARHAIDLIKSSGKNMSLTECVRLVLENADGKYNECSTTLSDAFSKYVASQEGKSKDHIRSVKSRVGAWVEHFGGNRLLTEVDAKAVSEDLEKRLYDPKRAETKTTYNNHLGYIKTFMAWCANPEQAYIRSNPLDGMKQKTREWRPPSYLSASDTAKLFSHLWEHREEHAADLADAILSFFCGMRQEEIARVREGAGAVTIDLDERFIRIIKCKGHLKGIRPRAFTIPDTAMSWMRAFDFINSVKIENAKFRKHMVSIAGKIKIDIPKNAGRHTFITMYSAAFKNQDALTKIVGNSEDVRSDSYDALASEKEGREYFDILPPLSEITAAPSEQPLSHASCSPRCGA